MGALRQADAAGNSEDAQRIAAMIKGGQFDDAQAQTEPSIGDKALGALEAAGSIGSSIVAEPVAGIAGIVQSANPLADPGAGSEAVEATRSALTFQPRTEEGQKQLQAAGEVLQDVSEVARIPAAGVAGVADIATGGDISSAVNTIDDVRSRGIGEVAGDKTLDLTGSPLAATIVRSTPDAAIEAIGLKGATRLMPEGSPLKQNPEKALSQATPSVRDIKSTARKLYDEIDQSGAKIDQDDFLNAAIDITAKARKKGLDQSLTPKSVAVINRIEKELGSDMTAGDLDTVRKVAQTAANSFDNPTDSAIGSMIIEEIDSFMDAQGASMSKQGGADVGRKYRQARGLWRKARKAEMLDEITYRASQAASGFENGLRNEVRSILKNRKKRANFSKPEIAALERISEGGTLENTLKRLGRLGFGADQQTNVLAGLAGVGAGGAVFGPVGGVAVPAVGTVSAQLAKRLAAKNQRFANDLVRAGSNGQEVAKAYLKNTPKGSQSVDELKELLMRPNVDINKIGGMPESNMVADALFLARKAKDLAQSGLMATPALEQLPQEEE